MIQTEKCSLQSRNLFSYRFLCVLRLSVYYSVNYLWVFLRFISSIVRLWLMFVPLMLGNDAE